MKFNLAISTVLFNKHFNKILLIKREKQPFIGKWSFPGGRLEQEEQPINGMIREVYEETGFNIDIDHSQLLNVIIQNNYIVFTGSGIIQGESSIIGRNNDDLNITKKFFDLKQIDGQIIIPNLNQADCIPNLFEIIQKFYKQ